LWNDVLVPPREPLQRVSTVVALRNALRERILSGQEAPGAPLRERELCEEYGVSRHSLRSAMQGLVHEGILRHELNRGTFVAQMTKEDVRDIYQVRIALETEAVRDIIERGLGMQTLIEAFVELSRSEGTTPWHQVRDADLRFHRALIDSAENERMSRLFGSLEGEVRLCMEHFRLHFEDPAALISEHGSMLEAIVSRDTAQATRELRRHLLDAADEIMGSARADA
jgi:DNA-binding GntR family transcriptional regulator